MDESCVGNLPAQKGCGEIKRKRKIHYRKSKGRLTTQSGGILNRSVYKANKSLNESCKSDRSQAPRVSIQNINSFLSKNRELAKALEDCRQVTKSLENEKFTYQMECIQMREKLSNFQNALLKCSCNNVEHTQLDNNMEILFNLKDNITQSVAYLEDYLRIMANLKTEQQQLQIVDEQIATKQTHEIGIQASLLVENPKPYTNPDSKKPIRKTKNKKLQVNLTSKTCTCSCTDSSAVSSAEKPKSKMVTTVVNNTTAPTVSKGIQCELNDKPREMNSVAVQCAMMAVGAEPTKATPMEKKSNRRPLGLLRQGNEQSKQIKSVRSLKLNKPIKSPFKIYSDQKEENKENLHKTQELLSKKKVTICAQPAKVHYYEVLSPHYDHRLRPRNANQNYNEIYMNKGLMNHNGNATQIHNPRIKVKKKKSSSRQAKKRKNPTIAIADLISLVEESFIAGQASAKV